MFRVNNLQAELLSKLRVHYRADTTSFFLTVSLYFGVCAEILDNYYFPKLTIEIALEAGVVDLSG